MNTQKSFDALFEIDALQEFDEVLVPSVPSLLQSMLRIVLLR
jgi:hypothetical protein